MTRNLVPNLCPNLVQRRVCRIRFSHVRDCYKETGGSDVRETGLDNHILVEEQGCSCLPVWDEPGWITMDSELLMFNWRKGKWRPNKTKGSFLQEVPTFSITLPQLFHKDIYIEGQETNPRGNHFIGPKPSLTREMASNAGSLKNEQAHPWILWPAIYGNTLKGMMRKRTLMSLMP